MEGMVYTRTYFTMSFIQRANTHSVHGFLHVIPSSQNILP